ncbi:Nephronectin [Anabarilius grahami]|uniref:Nephronectin n=1 Tax=Anabarilius grahami TaxID=495550 RepID=A0A3N0Y8X6_ANAGA|nr:Nephronectin [Anabarilius grahami]
MADFKTLLQEASEHNELAYRIMIRIACQTTKMLKSPICKKPCENGFCVGPDRCSCMEGYKGKYCNEDINECGLPIRPCFHRCMNTMGSYHCFCNHGYMLDTDGKSCIKELDCTSLRCQFGCQIERGGEVSCLCPPGLHLASDNRTCKDMNECDGLSHTCTERQSCRNTFGSFICVCKDGYILGTLQDTVTCRGIFIYKGLKLFMNKLQNLV